jgi:hypothetical protein
MYVQYYNIYCIRKFVDRCCVVDYLSGPMVVQAVPKHSLALRVCPSEPRFIDKDSWNTLTHTQIIHSHLKNFTIKSSSPLRTLFNQTLQPKTLLRLLISFTFRITQTVSLH